MTEKIDLHTHTTASDGIYTPAELIGLAVKNNVKALAITDHDTLDGLIEAVECAENYDISLIPGIEFSVDHSEGSFHLLGLYLDYQNKNLLNEISKLNKMRESRACRIIKDLNNNGINISIKEVELESKYGVIGRPHIARALVKNGYADNINDIFKNYLVNGKPGFIRKERISLDHAITLINDAGGVPVIAHPISLNFSDYDNFENMLGKFIDKGVMGLEVYSTMHELQDVKEFKRIAEKYNLIITGGSDFHGDKNETIGYYSKDLAIPVEIFKTLQEKVLI